MYVPPLPLICPLGPYPYCWVCRNYFDCPFHFIPPPRYPIIVAALTVPLCPFCNTALVWFPYYKRWYCARCLIYI
ncbi:MAG: hypothetical protein QXZ53_01355 [Candidatus Bathyarchaeia archaeon]